ncbi:DNA mismatch endonuclease Vsr [Massilia sp.]|uniref:very short patch repair endonuclease n=1 Tax=Massilia sp. TaxID=1882437 RepID=UPI0028B13256|nr:DNA mismatch endonuclease Vsr [Massilia sp.]
MVDSVSAVVRSQIMSRVRSKDTRPEMVVRRLVHGAGFRYRLHVANLPGRPDLVFPKRKKIIFVHGCFWHSHVGCGGARVPKSRTDFWLEKLGSNKVRDERNMQALIEAGWEVLVLWECQLRDPELIKRIRTFLTK